MDCFEALAPVLILYCPNNYLLKTKAEWDEMGDKGGRQRAMAGDGTGDRI